MINSHNRSAWMSASIAIESLLVANNPRGMAGLKKHLQTGYLLRAAESLLTSTGPIALLTGFPVGETIETDGPAGAKALYTALAQCGCDPRIWIEAPLLERYFSGFNGFALDKPASAEWGAALVIERPGAAKDGRFYNIRGVDISEQCHAVEGLLAAIDCPLLAIGDGGNEIGMGRAGQALSTLPIQPAIQSCDELIIADVSNWAAYALAMILEALHTERCGVPPVADYLDELVKNGAVDGVTAKPTPTEDNYTVDQTLDVLNSIREVLATNQLIAPGVD